MKVAACGAFVCSLLWATVLQNRACAQDAGDEGASAQAPEAPDAPSDTPSDTSDAPSEAPGSAQPGGDEQEGPEVRRARRHYRQGVVFFRSERYEQAVSEFSEAYALWPRPTILYSLGQAHERLLHVQRAIRFYERYLDSAPQDAANRGEVEDKIRGLRSLLATVHVESNVPARIYVDGDEHGEAPGTIRLPTGRHDIELRAEGYERTSRRLRIAAQTERTVEFELQEVPEATQVVVQQSEGLPRGWFWGAFTATAAAGLTAAGLAVTTFKKAKDFEDNPMRTSAERDEGERFALATDITIGTTLLFAVGTLLLYLNTDWEDGATEEPAQGGVTVGFGAGRGGGVLRIQGAL